MSKYLIYIAQGIGDFVIAMPLIQSIKSQDSAAVIDIFTCSDKRRIGLNIKMMELQGDICHCYYYTKAEPFHSLMFLLKAGYHSYDYGIVLEHLNSKYMSSWPSKIIDFCCKTTIGANNLYNGATYKKSINRPDSYYIYDLENDILKQLGFEPTVMQCESYFIDKNPVSEPIIINHPSIVFCIGSGHVANEKLQNPYALSLKSWPTKNWVELGNKLVQRGYEVILIGGSMEEGMIGPYHDELDSHIISFIGKHSIKESYQVVREADLVVGVDTGLIHAAAMQGTATLTLFGPTDPSIVKPFGPYSEIIHNTVECSPCLGYDHSYTCTNNECMQGISVDFVLDSILQIFKR
ncbi:MAG: glycosyltransferase family 9 protein [Veillonella sp.]|uniref:glycosyltransferase family 9 protein n=1 Tax=Veillonella sp. TaxID=1926307 RepID=UPI00290199E2|nr:glycosyltransferase family 9 protein [Veillonella sp.]MDU2711982.1 glycosyltransferase family 9 protein [Veillonella sp.]